MRPLRVVLLTSAVCFLVGAGVADDTSTIPPADLGLPAYPSWAHRHAVWLHAGSDSNQDNVTRLVQGYLDHDIPLGTSRPFS
jgi:hypothetical protein